MTKSPHKKEKEDEKEKNKNILQLSVWCPKYTYPSNVARIPSHPHVNQKSRPNSIPSIISPIVSGLIIPVALLDALVLCCAGPGEFIDVESLSGGRWWNASISCVRDGRWRVIVSIRISCGGRGLRCLVEISKFRDTARAGCGATAVETIGRHAHRGKRSLTHRGVGRFIHPWLTGILHNGHELARWKNQSRRSMALMSHGLSVHIARGGFYYG